MIIVTQNALKRLPGGSTCRKPSSTSRRGGPSRAQTSLDENPYFAFVDRR